MSETMRRSVDCFNKKNALVRAGKRPRAVGNTPFGRMLLKGDYDLLEQFADFLAGKMEDYKPHPAPRFLRKTVREADPKILARAGLVPLLNAIFRGLDPEDRSWEARLKLRVGEDLYERLQRPMGGYILKWSVNERMHACRQLAPDASHGPRLLQP